MARKRLNKKVALIGLVVLVIVIISAIALILYFSRDPSKFIKDGEKALAANDYGLAQRSFLKAISRARRDPLKVELLFKLADVYLAQEDWRRLRECWESIVQIEPANLEARLERLRYNYILADSGVNTFWQRIESEVTEFLENVDKRLFTENPTKWKTFDKYSKPISNRLDGYLYLLRGRAELEMARNRMVSMPEEVYEKAIEDLNRVREVESGNVSASWHLAQAILLQGEMRALKGDIEASEKSAEEAQQILEQCVGVAADNADAHIKLLSFKLMMADKEGREAVKSLEPECLSLTQRFSSEPAAFMKLADYYLLLGPGYIDKAVEAVDKAFTLDKQNIQYAITTAASYYNKFSIYGRKDAELFEKSVELANHAVQLPGAEDTMGPRAWANAKNQINIYSFLANRYIEQVVEPFQPISESEEQKLLVSAEQAINKIEQIIGSGENVNVAKWEGMLEFAKGNRSVGIRKMFTTYEQFRASEGSVGMDPQLPYLLAKAFEDTSEQGAVVMFLNSALQAGIARWSKPEAILDYSEALLKLENWAVVVSNIDYYDEFFTSNERSRSLGVLAYIGAGQFEEAEGYLASEPEDSINTIKLRIALEQAKVRQIRTTMSGAEIDKVSGQLFEVLDETVEPIEDEQNEMLKAELAGYEDALSALITELLAVKPSDVEDVYIATICEDYIFLGKFEDARDLINLVLQYLPDNVNALFYKNLLSEPDPSKVTNERRNGIRESVLTQISDPLDKAITLGLFYRRNMQWDKAAELYKKAMGGYVSGDDIIKFQGDDEEIIVKKKSIIDSLFSIALQIEDWQLAEKLRNIARINDLDGCEGNFYAARLAVAKKDKNALPLLNEVLRQRPVFSYGYLMRSNVHAALGNEQAAVEDARKAASLNPLDGTVAKNIASVLYQRNKRLGKSVAIEQQNELRNALDIAMKVNQGDLALYSFYADFISSTEPDRALTILQYLTAVSQTVDYAVMLGEMAGKMAVEETIERRKQALGDLATSAYEKAMSIAPDNEEARYSYARYLRSAGQEEEAEKILKEFKGQKLLWTHYYETGRYDEAQNILLQLYGVDKKDVNVLKGLLLVAEKVSDKEAAKKYSEELLSLEDDMENRLLQIKVFLNVGLVEEAEHRLQSFGEKYPDEPRALYVKAWLLMRRGQLKEALDMANRSLESDDSSALAWQLRGRIYLFMADYDRAIYDFNRSTVLSDDPQTNVLLARAYIGQGREENAIAELKRAVNSRETFSEARALIEQIYLSLGRKDDLRQLYQDTIKEFPESVLWLNRAARFALIDGDLKLAEQLYSRAWQKSVGLGQGDKVSFNGYLEALLRSGQFDKLFDEARKYLNTEYAPVALLEMADAEMRLGNKDRAVIYARQAADKTPDNEASQYETLRAMYQVIGREQVEAYCNERVRENPRSLAANLFMFNLKFMGEDYDKALENIDKCIEIVGADEDRKVGYIIKKAETFYMAYGKTSDNNYLEKAIEQYESLLNEMPKNDNAGILNNLAYMMAKNDKRLDKALEYAQQAYEAKPNNPEFLDTYAYVLYKNKKYDKAEEIIYKAIQQFKAYRLNVSWDVYERLGLIEEALGVNLQAVAAYKQALEAGGEQMIEADNARIKSNIERLSEKQQ